MRDLRSLSTARTTVTRSISPENPSGAVGGGAHAIDGPGAYNARDLGPGWKISPCIDLPAGEVAVIAQIDEAATITHIWATTSPANWRSLILRAYWDGDAEPAIEVPLGDFFCNGWGQYAPIASQPIVVAPHGGMNSYWPMPFRQAARMTITNVGEEPARIFYQVTYETGVDNTAELYLHAQWRRSNPLPYLTVHPLLDAVEGRGQYVGTYLAWGVNSRGWWGEGEMKFYLDDDDTHPSICGTGTEDYFGGAWNFDVPTRGYQEYSTAYLGLPQVIRPDGLYESQQRFGMYRWHVCDPITFRTRLSVNIQALGWQSGERYLPLRDDIASLALFYLDRSSTTRPKLDHTLLDVH